MRFTYKTDAVSGTLEAADLDAALALLIEEEAIDDAAIADGAWGWIEAEDGSTERAHVEPKVTEPENITYPRPWGFWVADVDWRDCYPIVEPGTPLTVVGWGQPEADDTMVDIREDNAIIPYEEAVDAVIRGPWPAL